MLQGEERALRVHSLLTEHESAPVAQVHHLLGVPSAQVVVVRDARVKRGWERKGQH